MKWHRPSTIWAVHCTVSATELTTKPYLSLRNIIRQSLLHGKHVLAEKSITLNSSELNKLKALADEKGLVLAEAMTIWHMPLYKKLWQIVESGQIGRPQMITMNFGSFLQAIRRS